MGQVCSGTKEESPKGGPLDLPSSGEEQYTDSFTPQNPPPKASKEASSNDPAATNEADQLEASAKLREAQLEAEQRKRKELWIVNGAARGMVAVRSTRGSTGYYDQGFAGLLAQHLEQTTSFPDRLPLRLPPPSQKSLSLRLAEEPWEGMDLSIIKDAAEVEESLKAAASGDPKQLMDALAESLLDGPYTVLPAKQQLFAGVRPMVENLL